ncbi:MAG TPA: helicase-exonuclease AddAB subunit AddA [Lachnospiraceae bacterium]|nr:helicase-exonuclease AddAB subunit AddA [Lachnospiraceae bacterium]
MGIVYTKEQQQVIQLHNRNLLVAAAAGSGKTAVLVERIIQMICDREHPIDIDRLLIVTFTNAAASEMRERINRAILKKLEEDPSNEHLQKQGTLIHNAQITTIDSFCLFVIRNNFNDISLDPGFRVVDTGELKLLMADVLADILEQLYEEGNADFHHLVECYSTNGKEKILEEHILQLYHFSMSYPFPEQWLLACIEDYSILSLEELERKEWMEGCKDYLHKVLKDNLTMLQSAIDLSRDEDGPYMYIELLENEYEMIKLLDREESYQKLYEGFQNVGFARLSSKKDEKVSAFKREIAKFTRTSVKENILKLKDNYFFSEPDQVLEDIVGCKRAVTTLVETVLAFMKELTLRKRDKNIIDFSDMEHLALKILVQEKDGKIVPTETAKDYQQYFNEILIDEYQDSNMVQEYLLQSISGEDTGHYNRFMVGDVKQSIYKFRLARPEIFMEKYERYSNLDSKEQKIDLHKNFRSREEVIESINYLFYQIMQKQLGNVEYDSSAALYLGADYQKNNHNETVVALIEKQEDSKREKKELEGLFIASKIKELVGSFLVTDHEKGDLRPAKYSDIAILLRSNSGWDDEFKKILDKEGIPVHITSKTGYFLATEIQTLLNFVRVLDNPLQDIPLFGLLKSPIGGFTEEEIALIRPKKGKFYYAMEKLVKEEHELMEHTNLLEKVCGFVELITRYRKMIPYTPIHHILREILQETKYDLIVGAMPGGDQRRANIDALMERALSFEQTSYYGLFHFIRYMEQLEKYDVDYGEANILDEYADTVRIMSIHKSKGLEFPICIVAGMSKRFNMMDIRKSIIMDIDMGIGAEFIDPVSRVKAQTLHKNSMANKIKMDMIGEELRILYVALTRAKEKLILTGVVDKLEKKIVELAHIQFRKEQALPFTDLQNTMSYLDFLLPALIRHRGFAPLLEEYDLPVNTENPLFSMGPEMKICHVLEQQIEEKIVEKQISQEILKGRLLQGDLSNKVDKGIAQTLNQKFRFKYAHSNLANLYTKTTVSELKKAGMEDTDGGAFLFEEKEMVPYIPSFLKESAQISGTDRGTAYHKVLELVEIDISSSIEDITKSIEAFVIQEKIPKDYIHVVSASKIHTFMKSHLALRMKKANMEGTLFKEQPFVLGMPANIVNKEFPDTEMMLIQGIIDVYFEEDGELVIADYKTDRVRSGDELRKRYQTQLDYYGKALEQMTGKKVKEKILYSFALEKEILLID